jgi:stage V sporulation protein R
MNEGFATYWHQIMVERLFREGHITAGEHAEYNYANSLVKAMNPQSLNPYLIGCEMWQDIVKRWDKGQYGREWENCDDWQLKEDWDTKSEGDGLKKMFKILESYTDWFFMKEYMTPELVDALKLYIFVVQEHQDRYDLVRTKHDAKEVCELIVSSFAHSGVPKIEVNNGNYNNSGILELVHRWSGADLDIKYASETMKHLHDIWGNTVILRTKINGKDAVMVFKDGKFNIPSDSKPQKGPAIWSTNLRPMSPLKDNQYFLI